MIYEGFNWRNPDYGKVLAQRVEALERIRAEPEILPELMEFYRQDDNIAQFINDWGITFDPRNAEIGLPTLFPFVLFPKQVEWVRAVIQHWRDRKPLIAEKSRDWGLTWLAGCTAATLCIMHEGLSIGFGSRKVTLVDELGNPKAIFPKIRMFLDHLPVEFRGGYEPWRDGSKLRLTIPKTGSVIGGEGGDQIGRGDRTTIYFIDEAQPLYAKIMTPTGWTTMADIRAGMEVSGRDGKAHKVVHVKECGVHEVMRVGFSDGTFADASPNHLWNVDKVVGKRESLTLRTHQLADSFVYESPGGQTLYRYRIPFCQPVEFEPFRNLPLDPYVLGALLGDGSLAGTVRITSADEEVIEEVRRRLPPGLMIGAFDGRYTYNIIDRRGRAGRAVGGEYIRSLARELMAELGIRECRSWEKFVPELYKWARPEDRLSLLQGLMDTDGYACGPQTSFHTSSRKLAEDVRFIVQSLGGACYWNIKQDHRGYRDQYALQIKLPDGVPAFRLSRKCSCAPRKAGGRTIVSVSPLGRMPVRCITVDSEDGLYLTDNFIVTHNSAYLEQPDLIDASLSATTNCRIDISTPCGMNNSFARKRWEGKIDVLICDWRDDPRKDDAWYAKQTAELDPVVVAQEIDRDYSASVHGIVIPNMWVRSAIGAAEKLGLKPTGPVRLALDVADEGRDKNAICAAQGFEVFLVREWSGKGGDLFQTVQTAIDICDELGVRGEFTYDADGMGAGVRGDARIINDRRRAARAQTFSPVPFRGSGEVVDPEGQVEPTGDGRPARLNKDYFKNAKAQAWWSLRKRFGLTHRWITQGIPADPDSIISLRADMPLLMRLVAELSQPVYDQDSTGKMLIDKSPDGMKSPNLADAVMMRFAPTGPRPMIWTDQMVAQLAAAGARDRRRY